MTVKLRCPRRDTMVPLFSCTDCYVDATAFDLRPWDEGFRCEVGKRRRQLVATSYYLNKRVSEMDFEHVN